MRLVGTPDHPVLSLPYSILTEPDTVYLVAGEDHRYTLRGVGIERWLPRVLGACDGDRSFGELLGDLPLPLRNRAEEILVNFGYGLGRS